jgi:hypothetical protein
MFPPGSAEREKLAAQRKKWAANKTAERNDQLTSYDTLKAEREAGLEETRASLERQKILDSQIKSLQEEMKIDRHRSDRREEVISLRREVDEEKSLRRELNLRRGEITKELETLRKSGVAGVRINGRRPERPSGGSTPFASAAIEDGMLTPTNSVDVSASHVDAGTQDPNSDVEFHCESSRARRH